MQNNWNDYFESDREVGESEHPVLENTAADEAARQNTSPEAEATETAAAPNPEVPAREMPTPEMPVWEPPVWTAPAYETPKAPPVQPPQFYAYTGGQIPPIPQPVKQKKKTPVISGRWMVLTIVLVIVSVLVTAVTMSLFWKHEMELLNQALDNKLTVMENSIDKNAGAYASILEVPEEDILTPGQVYAMNVDCVVAISARVAQADMFGISEFESFGSGFILSEDGYVVSNYHVVEGSEDLTVITSDSKKYSAQLVGYDATNDISLLKIDAEGLPCVNVGSSDMLQVGDRVAAIGNPLGELTSTLTVGYVSAKDRVVTTDGSTINMLQTDAAINSGNSGGPLFNMRGQVVGITTAKYSGTSSSGASIEGIGFAIPIDDVFGMIEDLRDYGYITGAYLGILCRDVDATGQAYGLPAGIYVEEVTPGYAAEEAGIQVKDIIVNLGGYEIRNMSDLTRVLRRFDADETTTVTVYRGGKEINLSITLDEKPQQTDAPQQEEQFLMPGDEGFEEWYKDFIDRYNGNG